MAQPAPANSGYALVTAESTLESLDVSDLDDAVTSLEEEDEGVNLCVAEGSGFLDDPSGLIRLQSTYDMTIPASRIDQVPPRGSGALVEEGVFCTFAQVVLTSPLLVDAELEILDDPDGAFVVHNPSVTVRSEVLDGHPDVTDVFEEIAPLLTNGAPGRSTSAWRTRVRTRATWRGLADRSGAGDLASVRTPADAARGVPRARCAIGPAEGRVPEPAAGPDGECHQHAEREPPDVRHPRTPLSGEVKNCMMNQPISSQRA